jgi:hypothetical protein
MQLLRISRSSRRKNISFLSFWMSYCRRSSCLSFFLSYPHSRHLCATLHSPFLCGPMYRRVLQFSEGKRGTSIAGLLAVESIDLAQCHHHPLHQRQWTKLSC